MNPWEEYATPAEAGPWQEYTQPGILPKQVEIPANPIKANPSSSDEFLGGLLQQGVPMAKRAVGMTGRALAAGATGGLGMAMDVPVAAANWVTKHFGAAPYTLPSEHLSQAADEMFGKPQTTTEKVLVALGSLAAGSRDPLANALRARYFAPQAPNPTELQQTFAQAKQYGFLNTPSRVGAGLGSRAMESMAGSAPFQAQVQAENSPIVTRVINEELGLPAGTQPTKELFGGTRQAPGLIGQQYEQTYAPFRNMGMIDMGPTYRADLHQIAQDHNAVRMQGQGSYNADVASMLHDYRSQQFTPDKLISGIQNLRREASANFASNSPGSSQTAHAQRELANRMEDALQNALPAPSIQYDQFVQGRRRLAQLEVARDITIPGVGAYDAQKLAGMLDKNKPLSGGFDAVANFARSSPQLMGYPYKPPGLATAPEGWAMGVGGLGKAVLSGLGGDAMAGGTTLGGLALLAGLGPATRIATRQAMLTQPFQSAFVQPSTPLMETLRNNPSLINMLPTAFQLGSGLFGQ